jgi:UDP-N-acetylglucosamine 4,6-dehydratase
MAVAVRYSVNVTRYFISGGTGSFGSRFAEFVLESNKTEKVVIYSRDEFKQQKLPNHIRNDDRVRLFLGDVRDLPRLERAMKGIDVVVHTAALKQVDRGEFNPQEFVKTNVIGSQNVIESCLNTGVKRVLALSTDKASSPINLYGATKLVADKLFTSANAYSSPTGPLFSVIRYGNVLSSRGSVIPLWQNEIARQEPISLTDARMTRFWITLRQAVEFVYSRQEIMHGGEIFVPKIPSFKLTDMLSVLAPNYPYKTIGLRAGEKLHEEMISVEDGRRSVELPDCYVIDPPAVGWSYLPHRGRACSDGFRYASDVEEFQVPQEQLRRKLGRDLPNLLEPRPHQE